MTIDRQQTFEGSGAEADATLAKGDEHFAGQKSAEAKERYFQAVSIYAGAFGPDHASVRVCLEKIAAVYDREGKKALADFYRKRAGLVGKPAQ
jgi:hypothetical protein